MLCVSAVVLISTRSIWFFAALWSKAHLYHLHTDAMSTGSVLVFVHTRMPCSMSDVRQGPADDARIALVLLPHAAEPAVGT